MRWRWLFGGDRAPRAPILVALLVLLNALLLRIADPPVLNRLRDIAFDNYQRLKPRERPVDIPVRIVDIDEAALAEYGQWPWPRTLLATLVEKLAEKGAAVIAFDVVFAEPDRTSLGQVVKGLPDDALSAELRRLAEKAPDNDKIFAAAIKEAARHHRLRLRRQGPVRAAAPLLPASPTTAARGTRSRCRS